MKGCLHSPVLHPNIDLERTPQAIRSHGRDLILSFEFSCIALQSLDFMEGRAAPNQDLYAPSDSTGPQKSKKEMQKQK